MTLRMFVALAVDVVVVVAVSVVWFEVSRMDAIQCVVCDALLKVI